MRPTIHDRRYPSVTGQGGEPTGEPTQNYGRFVSAAKLPKHQPLRSTVLTYPPYPFSLGCQ
jgi:hypothetical protein